MSFNDISTQARAQPTRTTGTNGTPNVGAAGMAASSSDSRDRSLSDLLMQLQKSCNLARDRITDMRRRKVAAHEKAELDNLVREIREVESRFRNQLDFQNKQLETQQRGPEVAQRRIALGKLSKDFDKIRTNIQSISSDSAMIVVDSSAKSSSGMSGRVVRTGASETRGAEEPLSAGQRQMQTQEPMLQMMVGEDVDEAIAEERAREIMKMNQDLHLVNEMMRDMASIVQEQGGMVKEIHASTEQSHEKAKAGLDQVKQAAAYQPTCTIS